MSDSSTVSPLAGASREQLDEIIREAESYLQTQITMSIAGDQRALTFAGFLAATVAALIGAVAALSSGPTLPPLGQLALGVAAGLLLSFLLAALSARPTDFDYLGNAPSSWYGDITRGASLEDSLREQAVHYDDMIAANQRVMSRSARQLLLAMWLAFLTLFIGGAVFIVTMAAPHASSVPCASVESASPDA